MEIRTLLDDTTGYQITYLVVAGHVDSLLDVKKYDKFDLNISAGIFMIATAKRSLTELKEGGAS